MSGTVDEDMGIVIENTDILNKGAPKRRTVNAEDLSCKSFGMVSVGRQTQLPEPQSGDQDEGSQAAAASTASGGSGLDD